MKSKFKPGILSIVMLSMAGFGYLDVLLWIGMISHPKTMNGVVIGLLFFLTLTSVILIREAVFKWNKISISSTGIVATSFLGLGPKRVININSITGFTRTTEYSKTSKGLGLYVYSDNKRILEISDAYYKNFSQLQAEMSLRLTKLGKEESSIMKNFLNAFGVPIRWKSDRS